MSLAVALHLLAAVIWVGGMLTMLLVVRPTAVSLLEPPLRLAFLAQALGRFFPWVWVALITLLASGYWMLFAVFGGMAAAGLHIHLMQGLGLLMAALFLGLYFLLFPALRWAVDQQRFPDAGRIMERIRRLVQVNALLGTAVVLIAGGGRYLA